MKYDDLKRQCISFADNTPVFVESVNLARRVLVDELTSAATLLRFTREIHWVRRCDATWRLVRAGASSFQVLKEGSSWSDYAGVGTALMAARQAGMSQARALELTPDDKLCVEVIVSVRDTPTLPLVDSLASLHEKYGRNEQRLSIPSHLWLYDDEAALARCMAPRSPEDEWPVWPFVGDRTPRASGVVWSSAEHSSDVETEAAEDALLGRWQAALAQPSLEDLGDLPWAQVRD